MVPFIELFNDEDDNDVDVVVVDMIDEVGDCEVDDADVVVVDSLDNVVDCLVDDVVDSFVVDVIQSNLGRVL